MILFYLNDILFNIFSDQESVIASTSSPCSNFPLPYYEEYITNESANEISAMLYYANSGSQEAIEIYIAEFPFEKVFNKVPFQEVQHSSAKQYYKQEFSKTSTHFSSFFNFDNDEFTNNDDEYDDTYTTITEQDETYAETIDSSNILYPPIINETERQTSVATEANSIHQKSRLLDLQTGNGL